MSRISVVIPIYNAEKYLERCLSSVLNQTFRDIEIIGVNDGSTDKSYEILQDMAEKDDRIRPYSKNNGGAPSAWQYGLDKATGKYLIFLDADDWIEPTMYETLYTSIVEEKADMSVVGYYKDYDDRNEPMVNIWDISHICEDTEQLFRYAFIRDKYRNYGAFIWNKLIRMDLIRDNDIQFDQSIARGADVSFFSDTAVKVKRMVYTDECLYHYTQWNMSLTKVLSYEKSAGIMKAYEDVIRKGEALSFSDESMNYIKRFYAYHAGQLMDWALAQRDAGLIKKSRGFLLKYYDEYVVMNKEDCKRIEWMESLAEKSQRYE